MFVIEYSLTSQLFLIQGYNFKLRIGSEAPGNRKTDLNRAIVTSHKRFEIFGFQVKFQDEPKTLINL